MFDTSTDEGKAALGRLETELVAWLTTVREDGTPQPVPVWFLWDDSSFLIFSNSEARKVKNLHHNPHVSINLNSNETGGDIVQAVGVAEMPADAPPLTEVPEYLEKYRPSIPALGMTEDEVAEQFRTAIRVRPERWQVW